MTCQTLIERLDERAGKEGWSIWRAALGHWCIRLADAELSADTIEAVLEKAVAYRPLPLVPRRPKLLDRSRFRAVKDGSRWQLRLVDQFVCYAKTKRAAEEYADKFVAASQAANAGWLEKWSRLAAGTEGVDFRYEY